MLSRSSLATDHGGVTAQLSSVFKDLNLNPQLSQVAAPTSAPIQIPKELLSLCQPAAGCATAPTSTPMGGAGSGNTIGMTRSNLDRRHSRGGPTIADLVKTVRESISVRVTYRTMLHDVSTDEIGYDMLVQVMELVGGIEHIDTVRASVETCKLSRRTIDRIIYQKLHKSDRYMIDVPTNPEPGALIQAIYVPGSARLDGCPDSDKPLPPVAPGHRRETIKIFELFNSRVAKFGRVNMDAFARSRLYTHKGKRICIGQIHVHAFSLRYGLLDFIQETREVFVGRSVRTRAKPSTGNKRRVTRKRARSTVDGGSSNLVGRRSTKHRTKK